MTLEEIKEKHEKMLYTVCLVHTQKAGGSGTIIYSKTDPEKPNNHETYILTNHHVIDDAITVKDQYDPIIKKKIPKETRATVKCEFYKYENLSRLIGSFAVDADVVAWNEQQDLALLKLRTTQPATHVAKLLPQDRLNDLYLFDRVYICGCGLGHHTFQTFGEITSLNDEIENVAYNMSSASSIYGNSGGAVFLTRTYEFMGIPSRISIAFTGFSASPITHMGYFIPIERIYKWLEEECYQFIYNPAFTPKQCTDLRKKKEEQERKFYADVEVSK